MKKRALVIGSRGQDGRLLYEKLKAQSYEVVGIVRPKLQMAKPIDKEGLFAVDLSNRELCWELLNRVKPDVIFHTAAVHGGKFDMDRVIQIYGLEMIRCHVGISQNIFEWQAKNPQTSSHFFLSSQMFTGSTSQEQIDEKSIPNPINLYGETKFQCWELIKLNRERFGLNVYGHILFNHGSRYTRPGFFTHNIAVKLFDLIQDPTKRTTINNSNQLLDISHSEDFIDAIISVDQISFPQDFVLSSLELKSIGQILQGAMTLLGIDIDRVTLTESPDVVPPLKGDSARIRGFIGNFHKREFSEAIVEIVDKMIWSSKL